MYQNSPQNLKKYYTREWIWREKYSICLFWWSRDGDPIPGHEKLPEMSKVQLLNRSRELFQSFSLWEIFRPDHVSRSFRDKWKNCQSLLGNFKRAVEFNSYRKVDNYFQLSHKAQLQQENCLYLPQGSIVFHLWSFASMIYLSFSKSRISNAKQFLGPLYVCL